MRAAAKQVLGRSAVVEGGGRALVHAVPVSRWEQPFAAIAIRTRAEHRARSIAFAEESAAVVGLALERETLLERSMARERSIVEAGERRFVRLGFDIHDGPIQDIAALAGDLHLFKRQLAGVLPQGDFEPLLGRVDDLQARLAEVDRELRELAQSLEAPSILRKPLEEILRREADSFAAASDIQAKLDLSGNFGELTASQRIALVRVVQEALTNIREHSGATRVEISVAVRPGYVQATITDNGRGFDVEKAIVRAARGGRLGLVGMSERIRLLGGTFDLQSRIGGPTTISATLPEWRPLATGEVAGRGT
jgi:signal transduction histidine kinase